MNNTIEDVLILDVPAGVTVKDARKELRPGRIIGVVVYGEDDSNGNSSVVRLSLKDSTGADICKLQNIKNYRSREAAYLVGCKPLDIKGGQIVTAEVVAKNAFRGTSFDVIFIYAPEVKAADTYCGI